MKRTDLTVTFTLQANAAPEEQRGAAFTELALMFKPFRRMPFATTAADHEEVFIAAVRLADEPKKPPD